MTINGIYLLSLCCVTMPLYSVVVILGDAASLKIELMDERHQEFFPKRPQVITPSVQLLSHLTD